MLPGKDAKAEEIDAFLTRMDIPKTAEEYKLDGKLIPGAESEEAKTTAAKSLADFFKTAGLTKGQAQKVYDAYIGIVKAAGEAQAAKQKALADTFEERLLKDIGTETAATETREYFKRAMVALNDKELTKELSESGMLYSTKFVRAMADIWKASNKEPPIPQATPGRDDKPKEALPKSKQFAERYGGK